MRRHISAAKQQALVNGRHTFQQPKKKAAAWKRGGSSFYRIVLSAFAATTAGTATCTAAANTGATAGIATRTAAHGRVRVSTALDCRAATHIGTATAGRASHVAAALPGRASHPGVALYTCRAATARLNTAAAARRA
jgi:hypothetical protein